MPERHRDYASYLLRLWRAEEQGRAIWLASLENTLTSERKNFASLAALVKFLQERFGELADSSRENALSPAGDTVAADQVESDEGEPRECS